MKQCLRFAAAVLAVSCTIVGVRAVEPGFVDLGKFVPAEGCEYVEVDLQPSILKFASVFVGKEDPEVASLIRNLKHIRVNVVGYNDKTRAETTAHIETIRKALESQGWAKIVTARPSGHDEDVAVFVKTNETDGIDGLVVTVLDPSEKHAVLVNIVGDIKPEQIAAIGKSFHIDPLSHLRLVPEHKGV